MYIKNGMPWEPGEGEGDRVCSEHFISKRKSDLPGNPDYVPSVYPEEMAKKCSANLSSNAENLTRFEQAQRCATANEKEQVEKERKEERNRLFVQ